MGGFLDGPLPLAFAHRGFAPDGTENSMAAFERAVGLGFRYLETDVRVTADGVALAFHDARLDRVTDRAGRIDRLPWGEVQRARIGGREPIPLLADVLGAWPDVRVNLDLKHLSSIAPAVEAVRRTGTVERVCVGAFAQRRIGIARRVLGPRLCTSLGPGEALALRLGRLGRTEARCAQVPAYVGRRVFTDARLVAAAHARGLQVHVWTVNDEAEMTRLLDLGVDGVMTDRADLLKALLERRNLWT